MKKIRFALLLALTVSLLAVSATLAQSDESLTLKLSRDWGYGGFNGDIQGLFSMHVTGPNTLTRVEFYIDETKIGEDTQAPFALQFTTDNYPLGVHTLSAIGFTSDGQELHSNGINANFVPPQSVGKFIYPVLIIVVIAILGATLVPILVARGKKPVDLPLGTERSYGAGGGGICPKCQRPFALPIFSMNLGLSKFARCPYCGKWSVVRVQTINKLREAEKAELTWAQAEAPQVSEEDKLRKELDDSKYQGQ
jgi:Bacterial Ig domain